jgi:hypothetical protein
MYLPPADRVYVLKLLQWWRAHIWWSLIRVKLAGSLLIIFFFFSLSLFFCFSLFLLFLFPFLFFSFFHLSILFSLFFHKQARVDTFQQWYSLVRTELAVKDSPISPTLVWLCVRAPRVKCVVSVSPSECVLHHQRGPSVQLMQLPCFSRVVCPLLFLILTWNGQDQEYPKVHTILKTCSCLYCLGESFFINIFICLFKIIRAISCQCFVYGHKLDHGVFLMQLSMVM